jgi:DNA polymerase-3 subunit delta'
VPGFEPIRDQKRPALILSSFIRKGIVPHALLFTGREGIGKKTAAKSFAMACNCQEKAESLEPCGLCGSCRRILSKSHPDIIEITPSGPFIRISQIRELCEILALKPYEARIRMVIISDAQTMNTAAGNALLKLLEEPPERTVLILTATDRSDLIPTIASRCQHIRFNALPRERLAQILTETRGLDPAAADLTAAMADGSITRALSLSDGRLLLKRDLLIKGIESLTLKETGKCLAFAVKMSEDRDDFLNSLDILEIWYRDMAVCKHNPAKCIFFDIADKTKKAASRHAEKDILSKFREIRTVRKNIAANANLRLTAETFVFKLAAA